mmetsp:Transcript_38493/g.102012  ORF Transcript_38493/g.102012 Transcript_38493/m.102012 type:complete len:200 (-) Transcript_38493:524-1123(-)
MSSLANLDMSCARRFVSSETLTRLFTAGRIFAYGLIDRRRSFTSMAISAVTRSNLFSSSLSQNATCWYASLTLPSSTLSSKRAVMCFASATVMTPSRRMFFVIAGFVMKVRTIGTGSAMPVVSMMIWSILFPFFTSACICSRPCCRSPRTVQHMQPLSITTIFSAMAFFSFFRRASSMEISPNSFSMMAIFISRCSCRM